MKNSTNIIRVALDNKFRQVYDGTFKFLFITKLKKWFLDKPNSRSLHKRPMPTSGGLVFVVLGTMGALWYKFYLPLVCLPIALIGLLDDRFNISRKLRYFFDQAVNY